MAKNTKFDCIENYVKKTAGTKFYEHADSVVMWRDNIKNYWQFFKDNQWTKLVNNSVMERGYWECDGADGFKINSTLGKTWKTSDPTWKVNSNPIFNCIKNYGAFDNGKFFEFDDRLTMTYTEGDELKKWDFYPNYRLITFVEVDGEFELDKKLYWKCVGENDYEFQKDPFTSTTPEETPDPNTTTEPVADDSFPLKVGKEGPNVVKLQKFLNDKIPSNPLTVNGRFDEKTKNKLIEYQKKEGIIE